MLRKKVLKRVVPPAAVALVLVACGNPGGSSSSGGSEGDLPELEPDQKVSITWESYNLLSDDSGAKATKELVRRFEESHPNIDVSLKAPQDEDYVASVQRQAAVGNAPDVAQLVFDGVRYYVGGLGAQPLEKVVGEDELDEHLSGGEHPYHPNAAKLTDVDGQTVGLPYVFSTPVLYYNATLFQQAGLDPNNPPQTWEDIRTAAQAITTKTPAGGGYVLCVAEDVGDWCMKGIIRSNGGHVVSEDGSEIEFGEPPAVEAVAMLQGLQQAGDRVFPNVKWQDALAQFKRGELGFFLSTSIIQKSLITASANKWDLRATGMPSFGDTPAIPTNSGSALYMFAKDPLKQRASWELMKYLTSPEAQTLITSDVGYLPLRNTLVDDPKFLKGFADSQRGLIEPNLGQLDRMEAAESFPGPNFGQITTLMMEAIDEVVFRGADPASTLQQASGRASQMLPQS